MTNRERLDQLKITLHNLNMYLENLKLENKYEEFVEKALNNVEKMKPISFEEWEVMLPKEKEKNLFYYYWCCRTEYSILIDKMKEEANKVKSSDLFVSKLDIWLNNTWVKLGLEMIGIASAIITISSIACTCEYEGKDNSNIEDPYSIADWEDIYKSLVVPG